MMITYKDDKGFSAGDLQELFQSVNWLSAKYPDRLKKALDNCGTVFTAWDKEKLVGLVNAIDDSELTAYVHYLCVNPEYQGLGIGTELMRRIKEKYKSYLYIILIAENEPLIRYYRQNGFEHMDEEAWIRVLNLGLPISGKLYYNRVQTWYSIMNQGSTSMKIWL